MILALGKLCIKYYKARGLSEVWFSSIVWHSFYCFTSIAFRIPFSYFKTCISSSFLNIRLCILLTRLFVTDSLTAFSLLACLFG